MKSIWLLFSWGGVAGRRDIASDRLPAVGRSCGGRAALCAADAAPARSYGATQRRAHSILSRNLSRNLSTSHEPRKPLVTGLNQAGQSGPYSGKRARLPGEAACSRVGRPVHRGNEPVHRGNEPVRPDVRDRNKFRPMRPNQTGAAAAAAAAGRGGGAGIRRWRSALGQPVGRGVHHRTPVNA